MDVKELRSLGVIPETHVLLPVEVVRLLVQAGHAIYAPAAYQMGREPADYINAARAAHHTLERHLEQFVFAPGELEDILDEAEQREADQYGDE